MQYIPDGTEIVLWGLGDIGKQVITGVYGNYKISFAVDRHWIQRQAELDDMGYTESITVYSPDILDKISLNDKMIVLSTISWQEIAVRLEERGKRIFRDYVPYTFLRYHAVDARFFNFCESESERKALLKEFSRGKKLCGVYGFCHVRTYASLLAECEQFTEEYCLLEFPRANIDIRRDLDFLCKPHIYSDLDLLILGFVYPTKQHGTPDWRTVKSWVNKECKVIMITNAAFEGYFPQYVSAIPETFNEICIGDKNLNKMIREGKTADEILPVLTSTDYYSPEMVNKFYEKALRRLELNESACDIQIADYIRKYGRQRRLMHDRGHPCQPVLKELTIRILSKIGFDAGPVAIAENHIISRFSVNRDFIYPSVYHALGITQSGETEKAAIDAGRKNQVTFSEFVDLYIKLNKPYLLKGLIEK